MNKKILITYGDELYQKSLERIAGEARNTGEFDEVIVYRKEDLPEEITSHVLFSYKRGGGYWLWKPYVCLKTLEECDDTDIVVYSDCGNKLFKHKQWGMYWGWMKKYDAAFFYNGGKMEQWCRKSLIDNFTPPLPAIGAMYQIISNLSVFKKGAARVLKDWLDTMMSHPEYVMDADEDERRHELPAFIESRHDQAVLSAVVYRHCMDTRVLVTRNRTERWSRTGQAVAAARCSDTMERNPKSYEPLWAWMVRMCLVVPLRNMRMALCMAINKRQLSKLCKEEKK